MKKFFAFLLAMFTLLTFTTVTAETSNFLVGRDLAPGTYTAEIYATDESEILGTAICRIMRPINGSYKSETISTDDMTLMDYNPAWIDTLQMVGTSFDDCNPSCDLDLLDGDRLIISCGNGWGVRLVNLTGADIADEYPGAIEGVNLTKAINLTLSAAEEYPELFPGLKSAEITYSNTLPSIDLMMLMEDEQKENFENVAHDLLYSLNISCRQQNETIKESEPFYHGGIYDNITVIVWVYDSSILYTDDAFDIYYIMPGTFEPIPFVS